MSTTDSGEVATIGASARSAIRKEALERLAWLNLSDAQNRFASGVDADAPYHVTSQTGMEYRRFLLLRLIYPQLDIPAPPLIDRYWRLHTADRSKFASDCALLVAGTGISPDTLAPPATPCERSSDQQIRDLYEAIFPCGDADLWGWPPREPRRRNSAPDLGSVHFPLPSAFDEATRDALREEAFAQRGCATESQSTAPSIERGSVSGGFSRHGYAHAGPVLHDVHRNGSISQLIAEQTGAIVAPAGAYYNYYRSGDSMGIHTDPYGCELVLLTLLSGPVEPLYCHLDLVDTPWEEIRSLAQATSGLPRGAPRFRSAAFRSCSPANASRTIANPRYETTKRSSWRNFLEVCCRREGSSADPAERCRARAFGLAGPL